jgi:hypothetical protein
MLSLVIRKDGVIAETSVLASADVCVKGIVPKRKPDENFGQGRIWNIAVDKRRKFGTYALSQLEMCNAKRGYNQDELTGFFTLVGIGSRWADDRDAVWSLYLGDDELSAGMKI